MSERIEEIGEKRDKAFSSLSTQTPFSSLGANSDSDLTPISISISENSNSNLNLNSTTAAVSLPIHENLKSLFQASEGIEKELFNDSEQQQLIHDGPLQKISATVQALSSSLTSLVDSQSTQLVENGKTPSYNELVTVLEGQFQRQNQINRANLQLNSLNYIVGIANAAKNKQLQRSFEEGKKRLLEIKSELTAQLDTIQHLQASIESLNVEVDDQRKTAESLQKKLAQTEKSLNESLEKYQREVEEQKKLIDEQKRVTDKLFKSKLNQDFWIDASMFIGALWFVNMAIIDYPLQAILVAIPNQRRREMLKQVLKLTIMVIIIRAGRTRAKSFGFHNDVGSYLLYFQNFFSTFFSSQSLLRS